MLRPSFTRTIISYGTAKQGRIFKYQRRLDRLYRVRKPAANNQLAIGRRFRGGRRSYGSKGVT